MLFVSGFGNDLIPNAFPNAFFEGGQFTQNGIEWCQENFPLYEILGEGFFEHHKHSLESRVCVSLYGDPLWNDVESDDIIQKLIEKSRHYALLEISESFEESKTGIIDTTPAAIRDEVTIHGITEDGQVAVQLTTSKPVANTVMQIDISFLDSDKSLIPNVFYSIEALQNDTTIIIGDDMYSEKGLSTVNTILLPSDDPVEIHLTIDSLGMPDDTRDWESSKGQVLMFKVVPEFGTIVMMIFVVAILSIVISTTKSKIIPRF